MNGYKIGSVYLDIAALKEVKSDRHNIYDWDNKMTIELKVEDLDFLCTTSSNVNYLIRNKMFNGYNLVIEKRCNFNLVRRSDGVTLSHTLSNESLEGLIDLLKQARIKIQGWD